MTTPGVRSSRPLLREQILISPWPDPTIDALGHDMRDRDTAPGHAPYVETFWLPVIGPTTLLLLRRANSHLDARRTGEIPTELLAQSLGLGPSISRSSKLSDTLDRAERYGFAKLSFQGDELRVRTHAPPLPERYVKRLPAPLQSLHQHLRRPLGVPQVERRHLLERRAAVAHSPSTSRSTTYWSAGP